MRRTARRNLIWAGAILSILIMVAAFTLMIVKASGDQKEWETWCRDNGGQVTKDSQIHVGTGFVNGKPVTTTSTSTTYYCIADGKLLGVRS